MRTLPAVLVMALCLAAAVACGNPKPPTGRWEGTYESAHTMIAARLEIDKGGAVYVSAPDAFDITATSDAAREVIRQRLAMSLAEGWSNVGPRALDFDGKVFRKPGGIAPQIEWNPDTGRMTLVVYPGARPTVHIAMRAVRDFSPDPWPGQG
jgi:hypothetical protein